MPASLVLHATTVAWEGRACLIRGASGSGKSTLALQLMAWGAGLIADDRTILTATEGGVIASCPDALRGMIEARGIGLLDAAPHPPCPVVLVVDLDRTGTERLPPRRMTECLGHPVPVVHDTGTPGFAAAILQYLKAGRRE